MARYPLEMTSLQYETTPLHELGIGFAGLVLTAVVGSFLGYHPCLISCGILAPFNRRHVD